jgi:hypothetical protein
LTRLEQEKQRVDDIEARRQRIEEKVNTLQRQYAVGEPYPNNTTTAAAAAAAGGPVRRPATHLTVRSNRYPRTVPTRPVPKRPVAPTASVVPAELLSNQIADLKLVSAEPSGDMMNVDVMN